MSEIQLENDFVVCHYPKVEGLDGKVFFCTVDLWFPGGNTFKITKEGKLLFYSSPQYGYLGKELKYQGKFHFHIGVGCDRIEYEVNFKAGELEYVREM